MSAKPAASPVAQILHTNEIPSDAEAVQIKEYISKERERVASLQVKVDRAREVLDDLIKQFDRAQESVDDHWTLLSPVRRVPVEVMEEIFLYCIPTDTCPSFSHKE